MDSIYVHICLGGQECVCVHETMLTDLMVTLGCVHFLKRGCGERVSSSAYRFRTATRLSLEPV